MKHQLIGWTSWIWLDNATVTQKTVNELKMHQQTIRLEQHSLNTTKWAKTHTNQKNKKYSPTIKAINQNSSAYSIKSLFTYMNNTSNEKKAGYGGN